MRVLVFLIFAWQISAIGDIVNVYTQRDEVCHCSLLAHEDTCNHQRDGQSSYFIAVHHCGAHGVDMQSSVFESFIFILPATFSLQYNALFYPIVDYEPPKRLFNPIPRDIPS